MSSNKTERKREALSYWKNQQPPESGTLYTDPLFPPNVYSLLGVDSEGYVIDATAYKEKAGNINTNKIGFARASDIFPNGYELFSEKIEMSDVIQGELGDCYFLSSVANLSKYPGLIQKLFKTKDTNRDGFYEIVLFIDGKPQIVIVDDYLPIDKTTRRPCYAQSKGNEIWVMLLEKAWAKVNGGYANIISGLPCEALEFLTGFGSLSYDTEKLTDIDDINEYKLEIVKNVQIANQNNCLISCSTSSSQNIERVGLVEGHAYTLISFHQVTSRGKTVYLFRIRNPWSKGEWNGDWSDNSSLWDSQTKSQVDFQNKDDGIFFMNDTDFFRYFTHVEICYILYDSVKTTYTIKDENLRNASVFNLEIEGEGFLTVSVLRKTWRANRELRNKILPTHISVVKYDPKAKNRLKTFSDYNGTFDSYQTPTINVKVVKGNYLVYVYRDYDHAQFTPENQMDVNIICSAKFKHAQMSYDDRDKGFPLLQNIILQAEFKENNFNPDSGEDFNINSNQIRGNGIGHIIYYISTPGYFLDFTGSTSNLKNYIMLSPYLGSKSSFHRVLPSGKYLVLLGLMNGVFGSYCFNCFSSAYMTNRKLTAEFDNNDIDLTLYTDINNDIKNANVKERKTQSLERAQKTFYFDIGDGKIQYKSLSELQRTYGKYIKLLDEITLSDPNASSNRWGVEKGEYVTYVGQYNGDQKEGKGLFINPNNIFAGEFKYDQQNGIGYTYNKDLTKLYYCYYINGARKGKPITAEEEQRIKEEEEELKRLEEKRRKEEELKKEQERLKKLEEEEKALLQQKEEQRKKFEEQLAAEMNRILEARRAEEQRLAEELKKAEEEAKRIEEEKQKEIQRQKEELERLAKEKSQKAEEERKKAEEARIAAEKELQKAKEEAEKKAEEAKKKAEEAKKAAENELAKTKTKVQNTKDETEKKIEEIQQQKQKLQDDVQKVSDEINNLVEQNKAELEEKKKKAEQKLKEEQEKLEKEENNGYKIDLSKSRKRNNNNSLPIDGVESGGCTTCGCYII